MEKENIPEPALKMAESNETYRKYNISLSATIDWYNKIRKNTKEVEFHLIKEELDNIDELITQGQTVLTWNSEGIV